MNPSAVTVGQAASAAAMIQGIDFSTVDWDEVRKAASDLGILTPEVADIINQFESGNFSALYNGLGFINTIASRYPADMLLSEAIADYNQNNYVDYASNLPDAPPPPEMNWGDVWDSVEDQLTSFKIAFNEKLQEWQADLGIDSQWLKDQIKEFAISKVTGAFFEQADKYLNAISEDIGLPKLYEQIKESKELYNTVTNFHTNMLNNISDAINERIDLNEFDQRVKRNTGEFVDDLGNVSDKAKAAVESIGSGIVDWIVGPDDPAGAPIRANAPTPAGAPAQDLTSFQITFSPVKGAFSGTEGNDALVGGSTGNTMLGGGGADLLHGAAGDDQVSGGAGADRLLGGLGADRIRGEADRDVLFGGAGGDKLWGGAAADIFLFSARQDSTVAKKGRDTIYDFSLKGGDVIDLHLIDANSRKAGDQKFKWLGTGEFKGHAGELRYVKLKSDTYVYGDVNGDRKSDFAVHFDDALALTRGDFVL